MCAFEYNEQQRSGIVMCTYFSLCCISRGDGFNFITVKFMGERKNKEKINKWILFIVSIALWPVCWSVVVMRGLNCTFLLLTHYD